MTLAVSTTLLPIASLNLAYQFQLVATGGVAPYNFAIISGTLPDGLLMSSQGLLSGTPTQVGLTPIVIEISDSNAPTSATLIHTFQLTTMDITSLSSLTVDQTQFVQQLQTILEKTGMWSTGITTQTSQTLIELISTIGTLITAKINRIKEDAFSETAQSDSAILAITDMQGVRLSRKMPASVVVTMVSSTPVTLPAYSQFSGAGVSWFNPDPITLGTNVPLTVVLKQGLLVETFLNGLGSNLQTWVSQDANFSVSDQDVVVTLNGTPLQKTFGGLWNFPQSPTGGGTVQQAYADRTLSDGRLLIQFGSGGYGAIPNVNDVVGITYAKTEGASTNSLVLVGSAVLAAAYPTVTATFVSNPTGGADTKSTVAYKNFGTGTFGTFSSGVTKSQYQTVVNNYPGIVDAVTQAQRDINPAALEWMNVVRVSALTSSPWTQLQIDDFLAYAEAVTMFSTKFIWQAPTPVVTNVDISVYCFNSVTSLESVKTLSANAITKLLGPRPGLLLTDFFPSDLVETAMRAAPGQISYVEVNAPTHAMRVSMPTSPRIFCREVPGAGVLTPLVYSYSVATSVPKQSENFVGLIDASSLTYWPTATYVGQYWIVSNPGVITDPVSMLTTSVGVGDQLLATGVGNTSDNFSVILNGVNAVLDVGTPSTWSYQQVLSPASAVVLDWSATKVTDAVQYIVWGRKAGALGIVALLSGNVTSFTDTGGFTPAVIPISAYSDLSVRYNALGTLTVNAYYAKRQSNALFPIRDTLS